MRTAAAFGGPAELWDISSADALITYEMLALSFVLCALIGLERQFRQKSAGLRTHTLVGTGSAVFTGLPVLAIIATSLNLVAQFALTRLGGLFAQDDKRRAFAELHYLRGSGALLGALQVAAERGLHATVVSVRQAVDPDPEAGALVILSFKGGSASAPLLAGFADVPGMLMVRLLEQSDD